jgi:hypothetical protein
MDRNQIQTWASLGDTYPEVAEVLMSYLGMSESAVTPELSSEDRFLLSFLTEDFDEGSGDDLFDEIQRIRGTELAEESPLLDRAFVAERLDYLASTGLVGRIPLQHGWHHDGSLCMCLYLRQFVRYVREQELRFMSSSMTANVVSWDLLLSLVESHLREALLGNRLHQLVSPVSLFWPLIQLISEVVLHYFLIVDFMKHLCWIVVDVEMSGGIHSLRFPLSLQWLLPVRTHSLDYLCPRKRRPHCYKEYTVVGSPQIGQAVESSVLNGICCVQRTGE